MSGTTSVTRGASNPPLLDDYVRALLTKDMSAILSVFSNTSGLLYNSLQELNTIVQQAVVIRNAVDADAQAASQSASNAKTSETNAGQSASNAKVSENNSAQNAADSTTSANTAASAASQASTILTTIQGIKAVIDQGLRTFASTWLGELDADPTQSQYGDPLVLGAEYYNKKSQKIRVYTDKGWVDQDAAAQADVYAAQLILTQVQSLATQAQTAASQVQNILTTVQGLSTQVSNDAKSAASSATTASNSAVSAQQAYQQTSDLIGDLSSKLQSAQQVLAELQKYNLAFPDGTNGNTVMTINSDGTAYQLRSVKDTMALLQAANISGDGTQDFSTKTLTIAQPGNPDNNIKVAYGTDTSITITGSDGRSFKFWTDGSFQDSVSDPNNPNRIITNGLLKRGSSLGYSMNFNNIPGVHYMTTKGSGYYYENMVLDFATHPIFLFCGTALSFVSAVPASGLIGTDVKQSDIPHDSRYDGKFHGKSWGADAVIKMDTKAIMTWLYLGFIGMTPSTIPDAFGQALVDGNGGTAGIFTQSIEDHSNTTYYNSNFGNNVYLLGDTDRTTFSDLSNFMATMQALNIPVLFYGPGVPAGTTIIASGITSKGNGRYAQWIQLSSALTASPSGQNYYIDIPSLDWWFIPNYQQSVAKTLVWYGSTAVSTWWFRTNYTFGYAGNAGTDGTGGGYGNIVYVPD